MNEFIKRIAETIVDEITVSDEKSSYILVGLGFLIGSLI